MLFKKSLYFALTILGIILISVIYYKFNPAKYRFFPKCPFHLLTGFDCPGCGSQRAFYCLLHGDLKQAAKYNVLLVISIPFLLIHFFYKLKSLLLKKDLRWNLIYHPLTPKIIFVVVIVFWIVRNIPAYPFSYLSAGR
jgi:Protein of unknown function (DUF2752)